MRPCAIASASVTGIALSMPPASSEELLAEGATSFSRCNMYNVNYTDILESGIREADPSWPIKPCQYGWTFNHTMIPYKSIAVELEWVCDHAFLGSAAQSAFFVGSILGGLIFGYIADHCGRIPALVACNAVGSIASVGTAFCNSFWSFCLARLVVGTSFDNCFNVLFIIGESSRKLNLLKLLMVWVFDGHVWNMKLLDPDVFTSFSLASLTELPAAVLLALFLDRWGRRWMGFASMFLCGIFSFVAIATPSGSTTVAMAIIARLGVNIAANIGFQYAAEMLPTVVRAQGVSLIHIIGYIAHILGPYIIYLADIDPSLPLVALGLLSFGHAFLTLGLSETLNQELPETLQEGNDFGKEQSFWWVPCISSSKMLKKSYRKKKGLSNPAFTGSVQKMDCTRL
ncbi:carcinine transporter-like [Bombus vancouverensis nearcticus]|uniref:carcinine transporter-like n=1 Tax=Bombus vancouverensis nearcticus TaxID=2705178 RepID=UPI00402BBF24